jgi:cysteinyl-tRNA synthetase
MRLYNTLTRTKEEFEPIEPGKVKMYGCGPTVYNFIHVGNARAFILFDTLRRYLEYSGYDVTFAQNFTDVDDKIIKRAHEEGVTPQAVADKYIAEYNIDATALNILPATIHPRATESIPAIIRIVKILISKGHAYERGGDVYFSVHSYPQYGKLSGQDVDKLEDGARVEVGENKDSPADFALWKAAKPGEISWDSPWGKGRPGWHIECSAMCREHLGITIDIHGGGSDLVFPHHENEIAQSEAANGKEFARYWVHNGFITIDHHKMSKSLGNFFTVREAAAVFGYETIRFFLLSAHYRSPLNYSDDSLKQAKAALDRLYTAGESLMYIALHAGSDALTDAEQATLDGFARYKDAFLAAMDDDLNTADALAAIFDLTRALNTAAANNPSREFAANGLEKLRELTDILGILRGKDFEETGLSNDEDEDNAELAEINAFIEARQTARKNKDFAEADRIRGELNSRGIVLEDTPQGVKWKKEKDGK